MLAGVGLGAELDVQRTVITEHESLAFVLAVCGQAAYYRIRRSRHCGLTPTQAISNDGVLGCKVEGIPGEMKITAAVESNVHFPVHPPVAVAITPD